MNKIFLTIATLGLLTLFTSAYYSAPDDSRIGYKAPALVLGNDDNGISPLIQHRGENVLVTFWTSSDAQSRIDNLKYDRLAKRDGSYVHVSVNLDRNFSVFNSIIVVDNLDRSSQFSTTIDAQQRIISNWRLDEGYHSFLLDKQGKILAIDPDEKTIASIK